jgi:hypothetical protein
MKIKKQAIFGNVNTSASSVVIGNHHIAIMEMIVYQKTTNMMCAFDTIIEILKHMYNNN